MTWRMVLGPPRLAEGLPTRWRPLYDDYGPVRPGLLSAIRDSPLQAFEGTCINAMAQRCQDTTISVSEQLDHRERRQPKETQAVGQTGAITLRVRAVLSQVPLLAFFALFVVGELLFMGSRTRERVAAGVSTVSAALGFQGRVAVGVSPCQTGRIWLIQECR